MHCCRLSHPSVYKVGKMSSTLKRPRRRNATLMQRQQNWQGTSECKTSTLTCDINYFLLDHSEQYSHHWICRHIFFWCHHVSAAGIQGKPICWNEKEKEWRGARMLIGIFAQIVKMLLAPGTMQSDCGVSTQTSRVWPVWSYLTWNTEEGEALVWTFTWRKKEKKKKVPACFISGN